MKKISVGILAHVDSGKTTLSEAFMYASGVIDKPGRVDHGNSFLDTFELERSRGITIFLSRLCLSTTIHSLHYLTRRGILIFRQRRSVPCRCLTMLFW